MPTPPNVSVGVRPEARRRLAAFAGRVQAATGRRITMSDALLLLIERAEVGHHACQHPGCKGGSHGSIERDTQ